MHLSLLSSPTLPRRGDRGATRPVHAARQHLDGTVRGLIFAAALLTPFALTFAPGAFGHAANAEMDVRPRALQVSPAVREDCVDEDCLEDSLGEDWVDLPNLERR